MKIKFKKVVDDAILPSRSEGDVGYDLYAAGDYQITPGLSQMIQTGISLPQTILALHEEPEHLVSFAKIEGRSSLAAKGVFPVGGIIDPSYRGEIKVILLNSQYQEYCAGGKYFIKKGDRIAQLVLYSAIVGQAEWTNEEEATARGDKGFGHTGK